MIAAAGDIACDPDTDPNFNGGNGTETRCRARYTSDLLVGANLAAVLALGDTQYSDGALTKFQRSYDLSWGRVKDITRPAIGNHQYFGGSGDPPGSGHFDYFNGVGNHTGPAGDRDKGYYSYDVGKWHLIALNSVCSEVGGCGPGSPQEQWLRADLAANAANKCTLAYFHHPLFSSATGSVWRSAEPLWEALYDAGADVVLNGHHHSYERFAPQDPTGVADPQYGIRQFVVGTGGQRLLGMGPATSNSEVRDNRTFGVLKMTLGEDRYEWQFVPEAGASFTDSGSASCHGAPPAGPPRAATGTAARADATQARLTAAVAPRGQDTTYRFEYGRTAGYGSATPDTTLSATPSGNRQVSASISGLVPGATYHYRVVAASAAGTTIGEDRVFTAGSASPYADAVTRTPGLLAFWRFGPGAGPFALDDHGLNLGWFTGGYALSRPGALVRERDDTAASFDGSTAMLRTIGPVVSTSASLEGWFKWQGGGQLMRDDSARGGWMLAYDKGGRLWSRVNGRSFSTRRSTASVRDGRWHHIVLTKDGPNVAFYLDGELLRATSGAGDRPAIMPWHVMKNGPHRGYAKGAVAELAVYGVALSPGTVAAHYDAGGPPRTTIRSGPSGPTRSRSARFRVASSQPRSTFRCRLDGPGHKRGRQTACRRGARLRGLTDGPYSFTATAIDAFGNADPTPARMTFRVDTVPPATRAAAARTSLRAMLREGLRVSIRCSEGCTIKPRLMLERAIARRLGLSKRRAVVVASAPKQTLPRAGRKTFVLTVTPAAKPALSRARSIKAVHVTQATDAAGNTRRVSQKLTLRR